MLLHPLELRILEHLPGKPRDFLPEEPHVVTRALMVLVWAGVRKLGLMLATGQVSGVFPRQDMKKRHQPLTAGGSFRGLWPDVGHLQDRRAQEAGFAWLAAASQHRSSCTRAKWMKVSPDSSGGGAGGRA